MLLAVTEVVGEVIAFGLKSDSIGGVSSFRSLIDDGRGGTIVKGCAAVFEQSDPPPGLTGKNDN